MACDFCNEMRGKALRNVCVGTDEKSFLFFFNTNPSPVSLLLFLQRFFFLQHNLYSLQLYCINDFFCHA